MAATSQIAVGRTANKDKSDNTDMTLPTLLIGKAAVGLVAVTANWVAATHEMSEVR